MQCFPQGQKERGWGGEHPGTPPFGGNIGYGAEFTAFSIAQQCLENGNATEAYFWNRESCQALAWDSFSSNLVLVHCQESFMPHYWLSRYDSLNLA